MPFWEKDKEFYATLLRITIPIALQNLISASLNMIDTLMIGQLGENQIAAVGLANEVFFLLNLFLFGICSGTGIFVAQFWGKGDIKNIRRVLGLSIFCGLGISGIFTFVALAMPEKALGVFTRDPAVIELGVSYLSIVGLSYVMTAITYTYAFALRNTAQPKIPMILSAIAVVTNAVFNYILIFGKLGLPAMGVRGAALATVIARALELGLVLWVVYGYDSPLPLGFGIWLIHRLALLGVFPHCLASYPKRRSLGLGSHHIFGYLWSDGYRSCRSGEYLWYC